VDTPDLAALVPELMARHPQCAWSVVTPVQGEALLIEIHPLVSPERVVRIDVNPGGEVYHLSFAGHEAGAEFAYEDPDKRELLEDLIKQAEDLATGPSRITRDMVDGVVVSSRMMLDPDGPDRRFYGLTVYQPATYAKARLSGRTITHEVIDFPSVDDR
jgi:hypothetical protein